LLGIVVHMGFRAPSSSSSSFCDSFNGGRVGRGTPIRKGRGEGDVCPETGKGNNTRNVYEKYSG